MFIVLGLTMIPRIYKRKVGAAPRIPTIENSVRLALQDVFDGKSIRGIHFDITLKRYVHKKQAALQKMTQT